MPLGDACRDAWYPIVTCSGPLLPAKPGPTLSGTRIVRALTIPLMLAVSLLRLLLPKLSSLLLLDFWIRNFLATSFSTACGASTLGASPLMFALRVGPALCVTSLV